MGLAEHGLRRLTALSITTGVPSLGRPRDVLPGGVACPRTRSMWGCARNEAGEP